MPANAPSLPRDEKRLLVIGAYRAALRSHILPAIARTQQWDQPLDHVWGAKLDYVGVTMNELGAIVSEEIQRFGGLAKLQGMDEANG